MNVMLIIKNYDNKMLKEVAKQLKRGAVVVYPTDTAYALGCDATNAKAVARIFKIKGREKTKALPMIVADIKMAEKYFGIVHGSLSIVHKHWPGPLSIIIKAKKTIVRTALYKGTAAVRVPDSKIARTIAKHLGRPLIATSANISYKPTCYSVKAFMEQAKAMKIKPDLVLDAGALRRRHPSTIVKIGKNGRIEVLRNGPIKL